MDGPWSSLGERKKFLNLSLSRQPSINLEQRMATKAQSPAEKKKVEHPMWSYEGVEVKSGREASGDIQAPTDKVATALLRNKGIRVTKIGKRRGMGQKIKSKDIAIFTRQLAVMMKAGVPMLQSFEIVAKGAANPAIAKLLFDIQNDLSSGLALHTCFRRHPKYFDELFCNLIEAGEAAGILEGILERLAEYKEKTEALKSKIKGALMYPIAVIGVAIVITSIIMLFVVPSFKQVFASFGAELPAPTLIVVGISDFMVDYWYIMFGAMFGAFVSIKQAYSKSIAMQEAMDRFMLKAPIFGDLVRKAIIARWTRTLATMFAAGVPLVEALESVAGAAGNSVYRKATEKIQRDVSQGEGITLSMERTKIFPNMVLQMTAIGEESGALDSMLGKVADFYEAEVDDAVKGISTLMEPLIMAVLGVIIGGLVIAMYLPIFKIGSVV
jgi:type IV pilus assembly protein PilC